MFSRLKARIGFSVMLRTLRRAADSDQFFMDDRVTKLAIIEIKKRKYFFMELIYRGDVGKIAKELNAEISAATERVVAKHSFSREYTDFLLRRKG